MKPGELVRIMDNPEHTFRIHVNKHGIYLGQGSGDLHVIMLNDRKVHFSQIEGNFAKAS